MINQNNELDGLQIDSCDGLHIKIIGDGEVIVFLHGGPGSDHSYFLPHVIPLSERYKLVFYDQRGCGKSGLSINNKYSMNDEIEALELIRKKLDVNKINLFGESWGTMLALLYATSYPERVNKIFLTAAIGVTAEGFSTFAEELEKKLKSEDKIKLYELEEKLNRGESKIEEIFDVLDKYYVYSEVSLKRKTNTKVNTKVNDAIGKDIIENYDLTKKLENIREIPISIAQGSHDILTPNLIKSLLLDYIPHADLDVIEECGHWTVVEKPNEINKLANEFFTK